MPEEGLMGEASPTMTLCQARPETSLMEPSDAKSRSFCPDSVVFYPRS